MNVGDDSTRNMLEHVSLSAHGIVLSTALRRSCYRRVATVVIKRALLPYNYEYSWVYKVRDVEGLLEGYPCYVTR